MPHPNDLPDNLPPGDAVRAHAFLKYILTEVKIGQYRVDDATDHLLNLCKALYAGDWNCIDREMSPQGLRR